MNIYRAANSSRELVQRAFTLIELLVVIVVMVLLMVLAIPSFSNIVDSSRAALAESLLESALQNARSAAISSRGRDDAAAVFFFQDGRQVIVTCVRAGTILDLDSTNSVVEREIFVPLENAEPVQLPKKWAVRGYAYQYLLDQQWFADTDRYDPSDSNWVFAETDFYDPLTRDDGADRQSFMVRFEAGSGNLLTASLDTALVMSPRPSAQDRPTARDLEWQRADKAENLRRFVQRLTNVSDLTGDRRVDFADRSLLRQLLGDESGDTVLVRPITQLALYDESRLASGIGERVDRKTQSLYADQTAPRYVSSNVRAELINQWINGDTNFDNSLGTQADRDAGDLPEAKLFTISNSTAKLIPVEVQR